MFPSRRSRGVKKGLAEILSRNRWLILHSPSGFDIVIWMGLPDEHGRAEICEHYLRGLKLDNQTTVSSSLPAWEAVIEGVDADPVARLRIRELGVRSCRGEEVADVREFAETAAAWNSALGRVACIQALCRRGHPCIVSNSPRT
jgi:SpoVK/Ycf46/Vps4 family AAA+-type ATPase